MKLRVWAYISTLCIYIFLHFNFFKNHKKAVYLWKKEFSTCVLLYWCHTSFILVNVTDLQIQFPYLSAHPPSYPWPEGFFLLTFLLSAWASVSYISKTAQASECLLLGTYHRHLCVNFHNHYRSKFHKTVLLWNYSLANIFSIFKWDFMHQFLEAANGILKKYSVFGSYKSKKGRLSIILKAACP